MTKILHIAVFVTSMSILGCRVPVENYPVDWVDRRSVFASDREPDPLMLLVEISADRRLTLNKIETGSLFDVSLLAEKLRVIFEDREKTAIHERQIVIDPKGEVSREDIEKLIESLAGVKASPIRVIKNKL